MILVNRGPGVTLVPQTKIDVPQIPSFVASDFLPLPPLTTHHSTTPRSNSTPYVVYSTIEYFTRFYSVAG